MNNEKYKIWLSEFCVEITRWIGEGCGRHGYFELSGICHNFTMWFQHVKDIDECSDEGISLDVWLHAQLDKRLYPFGGRELFWQEMGNFKMYENEYRLAWIADHIIKDQI